MVPCDSNDPEFIGNPDQLRQRPGAHLAHDTNVRYETTINASGECHLASTLLYWIEIEKTGFKKLIKPDVTVGLRFRAEFFIILNHLNFGNPNSDLTQPAVRPLDPNADEQSGVRRPEWRFQPSLPGWRTTLDPVGA
jgi:hypothetical protein